MSSIVEYHFFRKSYVVCNSCPSTDEIVTSKKSETIERLITQRLITLPPEVFIQNIKYFDHATLLAINYGISERYQHLRNEIQIQIWKLINNNSQLLLKDLVLNLDSLQSLVTLTEGDGQPDVVLWINMTELVQNLEDFQSAVDLNRGAVRISELFFVLLRVPEKGDNILTVALDFIKRNHFINLKGMNFIARETAAAPWYNHEETWNTVNREIKSNSDNESYRLIAQKNIVSFSSRLVHIETRAQWLIHFEPSREICVNSSLVLCTRFSMIRDTVKSLKLDVYHKCVCRGSPILHFEHLQYLTFSLNDIDDFNNLCVIFNKHFCATQLAKTIKGLFIYITMSDQEVRKDRNGSIASSVSIASSAHEHHERGDSDEIENIEPQVVSTQQLDNLAKLLSRFPQVKCISIASFMGQPVEAKAYNESNYFALAKFINASKCLFRLECYDILYKQWPQMLNIAPLLSRTAFCGCCMEQQLLSPNHNEAVEEQQLSPNHNEAEDSEHSMMPFQATPCVEVLTLE